MGRNSFWGGYGTYNKIKLQENETTSWNFFIVKIVFSHQHWDVCIEMVLLMHFDYACSTWYLNLTKKAKYRIQTTQNKCECFCSQLDKLKHISHWDFECLKWLTLIFKFKQCIKSIVVKYFIEQCHNYLNKVFDIAIESHFYLRSTFQNIKCLSRKTNTEQFTFSYIDVTFWNKVPDTLKLT